MFLGQDRVIEVGHVPDQGASARHRGRAVSATRCATPTAAPSTAASAACSTLIELVAHEEIALVLGEPTLVRVGHVRVARDRDRDRVVLVGHVGDGKCGLVGAKTDLFSSVLDVRTLVDDALRVVDVSGSRAPGQVVAKAPSERRFGRLVDIDHVEPPTARFPAVARAEGIRDAGALIDGDVMSTPDSPVQRVGQERLGHLAHVTQSGEVEHLHSVCTSRIGYDEGVIVEHLHVAPRGRLRTRRLPKTAQVHRIGRVVDIDERDAIRAGHERIFTARLRVGPAPEVVGSGPATTPDRIGGEERENVHARAAEPGRGTALTTEDLTPRYRGQARPPRNQELGLGRPVPRLPPHHHHGPYTVVVTRLPDDRQTTSRRDRGAESILHLDIDRVGDRTSRTELPRVRIIGEAVNAASAARPRCRDPELTILSVKQVTEERTRARIRCRQCGAIHPVTCLRFLRERVRYARRPLAARKPQKRHSLEPAYPDGSGVRAAR